MIQESLSIATSLAESWLRGGKALRRVIGGAIILVGVAIAVLTAGKIFDPEKQMFEILAGALGAISAILTLGVLAYQNALQRTQAEKKIHEVEERLRENPKQTQAAWELAQTKLESYINRNLSQVRSIFWLTTIVMLFGFALISFGIYKAFQNPSELGASIIAASSGIIVNVIGATFLIVFKSTMTQAQDYMGIIERINAVGMSVQILDTMSGTSADLKDKTTSDISQKLLDLYSPVGKRANK
ncbi:hypothetical protein [Alteromonas sp. CyTr2]|uniref:TRADD-N-associated membrane domain-containing protein n=1 Tax=Alteromonas sp. CyTr2 TaxID=2935039 RepID=UPI00248D5434|nr:hypothetical protein [Alteromonas sp. CyTr2]